MINEEVIASYKALKSIADELAIKNMLEYKSFCIPEDDRVIISKAIRCHILQKANEIIRETEEMLNKGWKLEKSL